VLITGAAGGLGSAMALEFASAGANLVLTDIDGEGIGPVARRVEEKGARVLCFTADLTRDDELDSLVRGVMEKAGRVDVLVNNAGVAMVSELVHTTWEEWNKVLSVNLVAPIQLTRRVVPHMICAGGGHVVNIASMAGLMGIAGMAPYTVTKFGLVGFSEALRIELAGRNIRVSAVCPGVVETPIIYNSPVKGFDEEIRKAPGIIVASPQKVARNIVRGVRRNKRLIIPSGPPRFAYFLKKHFPRTVEFILKKAYSRFKRVPVP